VINMKIIADITKQTIDFSNDYEKNIYFGFTDNGSLPVKFDNLSFGIILQKNKEILLEESLPNQNEVVYDSTDQDFLNCFDVQMILFGEKYKLISWIENSKTRWEKTFDFTFPKPPQPYPSWLWSNDWNNWIAPTPYPNDEEFYSWNEDLKDWEKIVE
jgi:hypothetical protein